MTVDLLLGLQWGDEGKGKIVDVLSPVYDIIARFQGGPNAGHTLEFNNIKHVLHNIPSGIFRENTLNIIGNGVVLDPVIFKKEVDKLAQMGVDITKNLVISRKAHLILPSHRILDAASEKSKGTGKIGSTLKGIGPTYMDKTGRNGLRVGDIEAGFKEKYQALKDKHKSLLKIYDFEYNIEEAEAEFYEGIETLKKFKFINSEHLVNTYLKEGKRILEFDHDPTRQHSPIIHQMKKIYIKENKSIWQYMLQLQEMGEKKEEYASLWKYMEGETEHRFPLYNYPDPGFRITEKYSHLSVAGNKSIC